MNDKIEMYWWEGCLGVRQTVQRIAQFKSPYVKNFGDYLSPLILSLLTGNAIVHSHKTNKLLAVGSILFALRDDDRVWGAGLLTATHIKFAVNKRNVTYCAVRGPKTRKLLIEHAINCPEVYGDPAILLPELIQNDIPKKYRIGIVTHFSQWHSLPKNKKDSAICFINAENSVTAVMQQLLACEIILSTSLHGLIVAEAYGIPAIFCVYSKPLHDDLFKFEDYFASTKRNLYYVVTDFSDLHQLEKFVHQPSAPCYDTKRLIRALPYKTRIPKPTMTWSKMAELRFKTSLTPAVFKW